MATQTYRSIITVSLASELFKNAKAFAEKVTPTTDYSDSNQFKREKIINDHYISKLGEEAVKKVLSNYGEITGPDYTIYEGKQKSWMDDLFIKGVGIAVKTQKRSAALRYGLSWTFQCGNFRKDVILERPNAWKAFVEFDDITTQNFFVYPLMQIKNLSLAPPKLAHLVNEKLVVYADSLPKFN